VCVCVCVYIYLFIYLYMYVCINDFIYVGFHVQQNMSRAGLTCQDKQKVFCSKNPFLIIYSAADL
jgi:hypothetical protein